MLTIEILKNNTQVSNYLKKISTTCVYQNNNYYIDYYVYFSTNNGIIYLFLDTSTYSNFYKSYNKNNILCLQYLTELSLEKTIFAKKIDEYTNDLSYFILKNNELKFISSMNSSISSWSLNVSSNGLYVSNKFSIFPRLDFIYNIDLLQTNKCNISNIFITQKLNLEYISDSQKNKTNLNILFKDINFNISYENAYILKFPCLIKVDELDIDENL